MEFLVEIAVTLPRDLDDELRLELIALERIRGTELAASGTLRAIWRVPGQFANCAIWSAPDATELHRAITSLPMWPYSKVQVTALAQHELANDCPGIPSALRIPLGP